MMATLVSFADNNGALTCVIALASLACWVTIPRRLVYLAFHFAIGKCYSNSLLATLNMRSYVTRTAATPAEVINIMSPVSLHPNHRESYPVAMRSRTSRIGLDFYDRDQMGEPAEGTMAALEIKVDRIVHYG
ncbi:hypothetical protein BJV77DRAFT_989463 [Russula vinacea]|nr:hypothetical protein BJV77DRAFT_989463 [Russula vinacea]